MEALKRPEGTIMFRGQVQGIFDKEKGKVLLMQAISGQKILRLEREDNLDVNFIYVSPMTGTRIATVNIEQFKGSIALKFCLAWSPDKIRLDIGSSDGVGKLVSNYGRTADYKLIVGKDGSLIQVGGKGIEVMGLLVAKDGKTIIEPPAIDIWRDTIKAINILQTGTSKEGYVYENVASCMSIVMLCTGFETYCAKRFTELEADGIKPDYSELEKKFFSKREREKSLINDFLESAKLKGSRLAQELVERRKIDFGNYDDCKDAFNKGYGIKFGEDLGVTNQTLEKIQEYIRYRHRIIHVSPLQSMLNYDEPEKEPVFAKKETVEMAIGLFSSFVEALHKATLELR